jgi:hypothetical protein
MSPPQQGAPTLEILARQPGITPHWVGQDGVLASRGYALLERRGSEGWRRLGRVDVEAWRRGGSRLTWIALGLRLGIHAAVPLPSGALLVAVNGRLVRLESGGPARTVLEFEGFRKPTRDGLACDRSGRAYLAQYTLNPGRDRAIRLWRSQDDGRHFDEIHRFEPGQVRHIHFVQEDPFDGSLWLGTGDRNEESGLYRSIDGGETWQVVGHGGQEWRAISLAFRPEAIYWGTDAGNDAGSYANRILRLDRHTSRLEEQVRVQGPVHGIATNREGHVLIATGLEHGVNESDRRVHLWHSADGSSWQEIASFADGRQPRSLQYAVAHFVPGQHHVSEIFLVLRGVAGMPLGFLEARLQR